MFTTGFTFTGLGQFWWSLCVVWWLITTDYENPREREQLSGLGSWFVHTPKFVTILSQLDVSHCSAVYFSSFAEHTNKISNNNAQYFQSSTAADAFDSQLTFPFT